MGPGAKAPAAGGPESLAGRRPASPPMTILTNIFAWLARHALVFILLVAAMTIYAQYRQSAASSANLTTSITRIESAQTTLRADIAQLKTRAVTTLDATQRTSLTAIDQRRAAATAALIQQQRQRPRPFDVLRAPRDTMVAGIRHDIATAVLEQEIAFLTILRTNVATRGQALGLDGQIAAADRRLADLDLAWRADAANIAALPSTLSPNRYIRDGLQLRDLETVYTERRAVNRRTHAQTAAQRANLVAARQRLGTLTQLATPAVATDRLESLLAPLTAASAAQAQALETSLEREAARWYTRLGIADVITPALWALAAIILTPFAIRTLFYWVLAPLASLQTPIRLLDPATPVPLPTDRSAVSRSITLAPGDELLVKQGFLQTTSQSGAKSTKMLLDTAFPITSLAAGLTFLTRIHGGPADTTTVSATRDPFAEITLLTLPPGAACVLQPRAIAGVVQPIATPLRITSHWRLGTLNAWLTWQLRFLVFHGPATIILTGGRGVRIEPAVSGRNIGQDQLIGFSAGLAYSTGRTETFLPYLLGQESLLKDRIAAGSGLLIAEESPRAGRAKTGLARGLEGAADALLKVFGI